MGIRINYPSNKVMPILPAGVLAQGVLSAQAGINGHRSLWEETVGIITISTCCGVPGLFLMGPSLYFNWWFLGLRTGPVETGQDIVPFHWVADFSLLLTYSWFLLIIYIPQYPSGCFRVRRNTIHKTSLTSTASLWVSDTILNFDNSLEGLMELTGSCYTHGYSLSQGKEMYYNHPHRKSYRAEFRKGPSMGLPLESWRLLLSRQRCVAILLDNILCQQGKLNQVLSVQNFYWNSMVDWPCG